MRELDTLIALIISGTVILVAFYLVTNNSTEINAIFTRLGIDGNIDTNALAGG